MKEQLKPGDTAYFMFKDKVREATVLEKTTVESYMPSYCNTTTKITYEIDSNPVGSQYTRIFQEGELFSSKQSLIDSL